MENYRRSDGSNTSLARMVMKALEFAPQVKLPGKLTGTVARYPDGSMAFVNVETMEGMTIIRPDHVAVAAEAIQESQGISHRVLDENHNPRQGTVRVPEHLHRLRRLPQADQQGRNGSGEIRLRPGMPGLRTHRQA